MPEVLQQALQFGGTSEEGKDQEVVRPRRALSDRARRGSFPSPVCDDKRPMIQPSEFILSNSGKVVSATYSTGPIGRLNADDVLRLLQFIDSRRKPGS